MKSSEKEAADKTKKVVTNDDLYRDSTQYRLWSFTPEQLREKRNKVSIQGKRRTMKKLKLFCESPDNDFKFEESKNLVQFVTEEEELTEINYYLDLLSKIALSLKLPSQVRATAIAFLKRFYLIHSVMEYHPKKILATCLFLAAKSENCFMSPKTMASYIGSKTTPESILEFEFELTKSLSFTLLCHHPYRALHGFLFDFQAMLCHAHPEGVTITKKEANGETSKHTVKFTEKAIMDSYVKAREKVDSSLITDTCFFYTPPQIALACFMMSNEQMTIAYMTCKFLVDAKPDIKAEEKSPEETNEELDAEKIKEKEYKHQRAEMYKKIFNTIKNCVSTIEFSVSPSADEVRNIDKKVHYCINPDKLLKKKRQATAEPSDSQPGTKKPKVTE